MELPDGTPQQHAMSVAGVQGVLIKFYDDNGWRPRHVLPIAGTLLY
jgi:hypothetical protein